MRHRGVQLAGALAGAVWYDPAMRIASVVGPALALVLALTGCESAPGKSSGSRTAAPTAAAGGPTAASAPTELAAGTAAPAADHASCGGACGAACGGSCGGAGGAACGGAGGMAMGMTTETAAAAPVPADAQWTMMHVTGMHCGMCAKRVKAALAKVDGVLGVEVDVGKGEVKVATAKDADARMLATAPINGLGFQVQAN